MLNPFAPASREDVMCTVRVVNTFENLAAHVELDDGVTVEPGDEVAIDRRGRVGVADPAVVGQEGVAALGQRRHRGSRSLQRRPRPRPDPSFSQVLLIHFRRPGERRDP